MNRDEMLKELAEGTEPLIVSAAKWFDVAFKRGDEDGELNCALCAAHRDDASYGCGDCPVSLNTGRDFCKGTPYMALVDHRNDNHCGDHDFDCDVCNALARDELNYLLKLCAGRQKPVDFESRATIKLEESLMEDEYFLAVPFGCGADGKRAAMSAKTEIEDLGWFSIVCCVEKMLDNTGKVSKGKI